VLINVLSGLDGADPLRPVSRPYVLLLPLAYRISVLPAVWLLCVAAYGGSAGGAFLVLCATLVPATVLLALRLVRTPDLSTRATGAFLVGDTLIAVTVTLALNAATASSGTASSGAVSSGAAPSGNLATEASWQYLAGCVALWTLARGVRSGLLVVLVGLPIQAAMVVLAGRPHVYRSMAGSVFGHELVLLAALLVAACGLVLLELDAQGVRARYHRFLHDTVLQTLEAMALASPGDTEHAPGRLRELRAVAHAQAVALRRELSAAPRAGQSPSGLIEGLVELVTKMAQEGLRVRLVAVDSDDALTRDRRTAVLDAAREALRNILRHAGVAEAMVRVEERVDGVVVFVRDYGAGFDEADHRPGFGLSQSIAARLAEVGGTAVVNSRPGQGTSVALWVPR
jgi:signal transduction histidine kinase